MPYTMETGADGFRVLTTLIRGKRWMLRELTTAEAEALAAGDDSDTITGLRAIAFSVVVWDAERKCYRKRFAHIGTAIEELRELPSGIAMALGAAFEALQNASDTDEAPQSGNLTSVGGLS